MKKTFLTIFMAVLTMSVISCRESTGEKTEEAVESMGEDIEHNTRKAGEKIEEGAENLEREIDEEIHDTDDHVQHVDEEKH